MLEFPQFSKRSARGDPNNYRPISVLPVVSKLVERVVFKQLYGYLNYNNLLIESQSGFRSMLTPLKVRFLEEQEKVIALENYSGGKIYVS